LHLSESCKQILEAIQKYNAETRSEIEQLVEMNSGYLRILLQRMVRDGALQIGGKKGREYRYLT
jgi:predicted HTH transcriptional regulator